MALREADALINEPGVEAEEAHANPTVPADHLLLEGVQNIAEGRADEEAGHKTEGLTGFRIAPGEALEVDMAEAADVPHPESNLRAGIGREGILKLPDGGEGAVPEAGLPVPVHADRDLLQHHDFPLIVLPERPEELVINLNRDVGRPVLLRVPLAVDEVQDVLVRPMLDGHSGRTPDTPGHHHLGNLVIDLHHVDRRQLLADLVVQKPGHAQEHRNKRAGPRALAAEAPEQSAALAEHRNVDDERRLAPVPGGTEHLGESRAPAFTGILHDEATPHVVAERLGKGFVELGRIGVGRVTHHMEVDLREDRRIDLDIAVAVVRPHAAALQELLEREGEVLSEFLAGESGAVAIRKILTVGDPGRPEVTPRRDHVHLMDELEEPLALVQLMELRIDEAQVALHDALDRLRPRLVLAVGLEAGIRAFVYLPSDRSEYYVLLGRLARKRDAIEFTSVRRRRALGSSLPLPQYPCGHKTAPI